MSRWFGPESGWHDFKCMDCKDEFKATVIEGGGPMLHTHDVDGPYGVVSQTSYNIETLGPCEPPPSWDSKRASWKVGK